MVVTNGRESNGDVVNGSHDFAVGSRESEHASAAAAQNTQQQHQAHELHDGRSGRSSETLSIDAATPAPPSTEPADEKAADLERAPTTTTTRSTAEEYSVYSKRLKILIFVLATTGTFLSALSINIYFAAINPLAKELHVSSALINLSLTTYLILQGLSPAFVGNFADNAGRRPAFLLCFIVYLAANIGLALQSSFAALLVLRGLQSVGISSTVALGFAVAADLATPAERGRYLGILSSFVMLGPAFGPTIGALLAQYLGWRAIFWFLTIVAGVVLAVFAVAFPETGRNIVGNGSVPPQQWNESLLTMLQKRRRRRRQCKGDCDAVAAAAAAAAEALPPRKIGWPNPLHCLRVVVEKDVGLLLLYNALVYTAFYDVIAGVPLLFARAFAFSDLEIGLSYIPYGVGVLFAPLVAGRVMDWNFRRVARAVGVAVRRNRATDLRGFPIERVRIQVILPMVLLGAGATVGYGWVVQAGCGIAPPLVFLFFIGLFLSGGFSTTSVMFVDYYPESPATATAANNLCRCLLGAGGTGIINIMIDKMGTGWCYTFHGLVVIVASCVCMLVLLKKGPGWREERRLRVEKKKNAEVEGEACRAA